MAYDETTASVMRENDKMLAALKHIAAIAHSGGLAGLDEFDAMCAVRRLTLKYWDNKQTEDEERLSAVDAVRASYCAIGHNVPHEGPGAASSRTVPLDAVVGPLEETENKE